jgi:hypothetical protein
MQQLKDIHQEAQTVLVNHVAKLSYECMCMCRPLRPGGSV